MANYQFPKLMALRTHAQRMFVLEYTARGFERAAEAAKAAGYSGTRRSAVQLMANNAVKEAIEEQQRAAERALEAEYGPLRNRIITELCELAFRETNSMANLADWTPEQVTLRPSEDLSEEVAGTLRKIKQGAHGVELEGYDRGANLERLAKVLGLMKGDEAPPGAVRLIIENPKA